MMQDVYKRQQLILAGVVVFMVVKSVGVYLVARLLRASHAEALTRAALLAQGGEFAFVLYGAAAAAGIFDAHLAAVPVSYTHLDVYKRQRHARAGPRDPGHHRRAARRCL